MSLSDRRIALRGCRGLGSRGLGSRLPAPEESGQKSIEISFVKDAYALCGKSRPQVVILVIEMIVGFQSKCAGGIEQLFKIEISYECGVGCSAIPITYVSIEKQTVIE